MNVKLPPFEYAAAKGYKRTCIDLNDSRISKTAKDCCLAIFRSDESRHGDEFTRATNSKVLAILRQDYANSQMKNQLKALKKENHQLRRQLALASDHDQADQWLASTLVNNLISDSKKLGKKEVMMTAFINHHDLLMSGDKVDPAVARSLHPYFLDDNTEWEDYEKGLWKYLEWSQEAQRPDRSFTDEMAAIHQALNVARAPAPVDPTVPQAGGNPAAPPAVADTADGVARRAVADAATASGARGGAARSLSFANIVSPQPSIRARTDSEEDSENPNPSKKPRGTKTSGMTEEELADLN